MKKPKEKTPGGETNCIVFHIILRDDTRVDGALCFQWFWLLERQLWWSCEHLHGTPLYSWAVWADCKVQTPTKIKKKKKKNVWRTNSAHVSVSVDYDHCGCSADASAYLHFKQRRTQDVFQGDVVNHYWHLRRRRLLWAHMKQIESHWKALLDVGHT